MSGIIIKAPVLDKGYVCLVDFMGSDLSIVRSARVSFDADWRTGEDAGKDEKLIHYLWKNGHTSPFESVTMTFEVKAPIFVFRQWHRHRTQSYNELSARYAELEDEFYIPRPEQIGEQSKDNKQARMLHEDDLTDEFRSTRQGQIDWYQYQCEEAFRTYHHFLENGWPRELARMVLPVSTYSKMFVTMNLLNCFRFLKLRLHEHAQYEIRVYADAIIRLLSPQVPIAAQAFITSLNEN